jgi:hypothetical protein
MLNPGGGFEGSGFGGLHCASTEGPGTGAVKRGFVARDNVDDLMIK